MIEFLGRRLLSAIVVAFGVSLLAFSMSHLTPGDPVSIMLGERASAQSIKQLTEQLGLDQPLPVQYFTFVTRALQGNLGTSIRSGQPVLSEIASRFRPTLQLTLAAMMIAAALGIGFGVLAAVSRTVWLETLIMAFALLGISIPTFWSGLLFIMFFALTLNWLPVTRAYACRGSDLA